MISGIYDVHSSPTILNHFQAVQPYVNDVSDIYDDDMARLLLEARIRSNDYFATLSTELEKLADILERSDVPEAGALAQLSHELAYLDLHYTLQSKK